ncbi:MAG: hypothetical protein A2Y60_04625 [Chloroflexi bacterium RBG_13_54_9]|nr:MAG: hypothetical protein A2Y60_04625 [Chloroflexi bacterium RBG_13_54_9]
MERIRDILEWGAVVYPMRYEPIGVYDTEGNPLRKNQFVSRHWDIQLLEMVARARCVIGYGGAFPPYEGLKKKICNAHTLEEGLALREPSQSKLKLNLRGY